MTDGEAWCAAVHGVEKSRTRLSDFTFTFTMNKASGGDGPITPWQIDRETMEIVTDFIFLGSKITACGDCSQKIKRLAPWKKSYGQPRQYIKKQRHYFTNEVHLVKALVFPVVVYGCESLTIKKAECQRIDACGSC